MRRVTVRALRGGESVERADPVLQPPNRGWADQGTPRSNPSVSRPAPLLPGQLLHTNPRTFSDNTTVPDTPHGHLAALREALGTSGFTPRAYERHVSDNLAVVNIIIPGLERFFLITEGDVVVPGSRGITFLNHP